MSTTAESIMESTASDPVRDQELARLAQLVAEVDPAAWDQFVENEMAPEVIKASMALVKLLDAAEQRIREARHKAQEARALARRLGAPEITSLGQWARGLEPVIGRVSRLVAEAHRKAGVDHRAADMAAELVEPARANAYFARRAGA